MALIFCSFRVTIDIMEDPAKAAFAFSKLTAINSRRSARYTAAADKVKSVHLKIIFMNYAFLAQQLHIDLMRWIVAYGVTVHPRESSLFSEVWEKIKDQTQKFSVPVNNWKKKR